MSEQVFHLVSGKLRPELTRPQGCAEKRNHGLPPGLHQQVVIIVDARNPIVGRSVQPSRGDHCVHMRVEFQFAVEGVENGNDANPQTMPHTHLRLYYLRG